MATCKNCGAEVKDGATFCPICGKVLVVKEKQAICPVCDTENALEAVFCVKCGATMPGEKDTNLESESIQKLKALIPKISSVSATFADPYSGADKAALTYVCPVCGKRNDLNAQRCVRCGRDRKRSAQLAAKKRIASFKDAVEVPNKKYKPAPVEVAEEAVEEFAPELISETAVVPEFVEDAAEEIAAPVDAFVAPEAEAAPVEEVAAVEEESIDDIIAAALFDVPAEVVEEVAAPIEEVAAPAPVEVVEEEVAAPAEEEVVEEAEEAKEEAAPAEEAKPDDAKEQVPPYGYPPYGYPPYGYPPYGYAPPQDAQQYGGYPQYAYPYGYGQLPPIIQPIAFVPYVSQDQPLWQVATPDEVASSLLHDSENGGDNK